MRVTGQKNYSVPKKHHVMTQNKVIIKPLNFDSPFRQPLFGVRTNTCL